MKLPRRALLAGGAFAFGLSPLARLFGGALAAQPTAGVTNLVCIYMPHGVARELWRPRAGFDLAYPDSSLAPFDDASTFGQSFRERLLVVEGLDLTAGIKGGSAGHDGSRALFTGSAFEGKNASLDQFLALESGLAGLTPLDSLVLGIGSPETRISTCISYARGGTPLPKLVSPSQTYHEVIGQWQVGASAAASAAAAASRRAGRSVLDVVQADLNTLAARVGAADKAKLDAHATALRALEKKLNGFELSCGPSPAAPDADLDPTAPSAFDRATDLQCELAAFAIGCKITRFVSLYLPDLSYTGFDPALPTDIHEAVAHRYSASSDDGTTLGDPATWRALAHHNRYSYGKVARLLQLLAEAGALDSTLVLASSDMGDPARHSSRNVPTVLACGARSRLRAGRYVDVRTDGAGIPNNRLLVTVARELGVDLDSFGDAAPDIAQGALDLS